MKILDTCRSCGILSEKRNSGFTFPEGLTHPSLSLCRPEGLIGIGLRAEGREYLNLLNPLNLLNLLNPLNPLNPLNLLNLLNLLNPYQFSISTRFPWESILHF